MLRTSWVDVDDVANDDWLISPELSGDAQTISFSARAFKAEYPETIQVYYSQKNTEITFFKQVGDPITLTNTDWQTFEFDVPEGAKYFAIQVVSVNMYYVYLDNLTFVPKFNLNNLICEDFTRAGDDDVIADDSYHGFTFINANGNCKGQDGTELNQFEIRNQDDCGDCLFLTWSYPTGTDNWLISPNVVPGGQEIGFSIKAQIVDEEIPHKIEVYAAAEPTLQAFRATSPILTLGYADFEQEVYKDFIAQLPADARYFAIRVNEIDGSLYYFDNFCFVPGPTYNVYCNDEKVNAAQVNACSFYDKSYKNAGDYSYVVEAVYNDGTTGRSEPVTVTVSAADISYPAPGQLTGSLSIDGVALSWFAAENTTANTQPFTESFEGYESGNADGSLGPWTLVNNNGLSHASGQGTNPWYVLEGSDSHSKVLASNFISGETNDDWLISPRLNPDGQKISFYARRGADDSEEFETFSVYCSYTGNAVEDFTESVKYIKDLTHEWTQFEMKIPQGANYFAIVYQSTDKFKLFVDDITYTPRDAANGPARKIFSHLLGYNIYRDGVKLNSAPVETTDFLDPNPVPGKVNEYTVKAVYADSESEASNVFTIDVPADPVPNNVIATITPEGLNVSWIAVDTALNNTDPVTESFEDYEAGNVDGSLGPWTLVNNNSLSHAYGQDTNPWYVLEGSDSHSKVLASNFINGETNDDWLISPRLNPDGQTVTFFARRGADDSDELETVSVYYSLTGNSVADFTCLQTIDNLPHEWTRIEASLPAGACYFAIVYGSTDKFKLFLDDITYIPAKKADAAPARKIRDLRGYNVYCNGELINAEPVEGTSLLHNSIPGAGTYSYTVTAVYASGETEASAPYVVILEDTDIELHAVEEVNGTVSETGVTLTWTEPAPATTEIEMFEDFSAYSSTELIYDSSAQEGDPVYGYVGNWTLLNADGIMQTFNDPEHLDQKSIYSWQFATFLGKKCLVDGCAISPINDWIMSPLLSGSAQTVSFYASSVYDYDAWLDRLEVLVSYTDNFIDSFEDEPLLTIEKVPYGWTRYEVEIPAGVKCFAFRNTSQNKVGVAITDITYKAPYNKLCGTLIGYNIYRQAHGGAAMQARGEAEWVKVNDTPVTETSFTDTPDNGTYVYKVAAVYPYGESELGGNFTAIVDNTTGIGSVKAEAADSVAEYFTLQGVRVERPVSGQVYIVRRGTTVTKQLVK